MEENYKKSIHRIKKLRESVKRRTDVYSGLASIGDKETARSMRALQKAPSPGKKLQKIGLGLLLAPEPVTTPIGCALIVTGKILEKKYNSSTIADIGNETTNTIDSIKDIKDTIN
ncbi:MAG TPA: hypothetical protein VLD38_00425 [Nitrosopumilaceae archaeon]|nr:hypothetical protein [Nitrosopumilaceae archaeon]